MVARLQRHVSCTAFEPIACVLFGNPQRNCFGMIQQVVLMPAFARNLPGAVQNDATHSRVGRTDRNAASRQFQCALHPMPVYFQLIHRHPSNESRNAPGENSSRSLICSPTPTKRTGKLSSLAIATAMPPFAVPSNLVRTMPVTPAD